MKRRTLVLLGVLAALALPGPRGAAADDPTAEEVAALERGVYLGRVAEAWAAIEPHAQDAAWSNLAWALWEWRRWSGSAPAVAPEGTPAAKIPVLRALRLERDQRETHGWSGLPATSDLAELDDPEGLHAAFLGLQRSVFDPPADSDPSATTHADDLRRSAYRIALLALAATLALAAALGLTLGGRPTAPTGTGRP